MTYSYIIRLQDLMSGPLARINSFYSSSASRWDGLSRRLQSGFRRTTQTVSELSSKLFGLDRARRITVDASQVEAATRQVTELNGQLVRADRNGRLRYANGRFAGDGSGRSSRSGGGVFGGSFGQMDFKSLTRAAMPYIGAAAITSAVVSGFQDYAQIDAYKRGLKNIEGSQAGADRRFNELRQVAAMPGLGLEEAVKGDLRLRSLGFTADQSKNSLMNVGNALALTGGGKFELDSVVTQFTQMASKSSVLSEDLKPILNAGPAIAKAVKDMYGTVNSEEISDKLKKAGKGPMDFINSLVSKLGTLEKVTGGPKNALENLGDSAKIAGYNAGVAADKYLDLTGKLDALGTFVTNLSDQIGPVLAVLVPPITRLWTALTPLWNTLYGIGLTLGLVGTQANGVSGTVNYLATIINILATAVELALSPVGQLILLAAGMTKGLLMLSAYGVKGLIASLQSLWAVMLANPFTAILIGMLAIGTGLKYAWDNIDGFREAILKAWEVTKAMFSAVGPVLKALFLPTPANISAAIDAVKKGWSTGLANGAAAVKADRAERLAQKAQKLAGAPAAEAPTKPAAGGDGGVGKAGGVDAAVSGAKSTHITINFHRALIETMTIVASSVDEGINRAAETAEDALLRVVGSSIDV